MAETKKEKGTGKELVKTKKTAVANGPNQVERIKTFFRGVLSEVKKVHWPNRRELIVYTTVVLITVAFVGLLIWIFDSIFGWAIGLLIK